MTAATSVLGAAARLPAPASRLIGRADVLEHVVTAFGTRGVRLLTLTGLGGVGKTRVALEVGWQLRGDFRDGIAFVDLSAVTDAAAVADELCRQLGIASFVGGDSVQRLSSALGGRGQLIVVDNFEQILDAAPVLGLLVARCREVALLVTSRRPLRLSGEEVVPVPPLAVGDPADSPAEFPAVELYCERARAVDIGFRPDPPTLSAVAELCRNLDGLPLAIELAAARTRTLRPQQLLDRLARAAMSDQPWATLDRPPADAAPRHRGLHEAIGWSVDLLDDDATTLFRRLGVFAGPFSAEAAEAVCGDSDNDSDSDSDSDTGSDTDTDTDSDGGDGRAVGRGRLAVGRVLDALATLVDLHLVEPVPDAADGIARFQLLRTIATAARQRLDEAGELATLRARHARFYRDLAVRADVALESADEALWYRRIDASLADLTAAFDWLHAHGRGVDLARAVGGMGPYWLNAGRFAIGRRWLAAVEAQPEPLPAEVSGVCRGWSARLDLDGQAGSMSEQDAARITEYLDQVFAQTPHHPARRWLRNAEHLTYALRLYGDVERARQISAAAVDRCTAPELAWWRAEHLVRSALLADQVGDSAAAVHLAGEAAVAADASGNARARARAAQAEILSDAALSEAAAAGRLHEVLERTDAFGDRRGAVTTVVVLAAMAARRGDVAGFGRRIGWAIRESRDIGYHHGIGLAQITLVVQAAAAGDWSAVLEQDGALAARWPTLRRQLPHAYVGVYEQAVAGAERALGSEAGSAVRAAGRRWSWDRGVDAALARATALAATPGPGEPDAPVTPLTAVPTTPATAFDEPLTSRELEVLSLIARGLTNQQIAATLVLSAKTVMHHSSHIYRKLGVRGRAEAVALAGRSGLLAPR